MKMRVLAGLSTLAFLVLFLVKTACLLWPEWFGIQPVERGLAVALVAASFLLVVFFIQLRTVLEDRGLLSLATAATIGIFGAGIGGLVELRSLLASVGMATMTREAVAACWLGEVTAAVALLAFFVIVHRRAARRVGGTGLAILGSSICVALTVTIFVLHVTGLDPGWLLGWYYLPAVVLALAAALALYGLVRFFALLALHPCPLVGEGLLDH